MAKRNAAIGLVALLVVAITGMGIYWTMQTGTQGVRTALSISNVDLGITYLPVTKKTAPIYGLGVDFGALVTEVSRRSPAELAGLRAGDVILTFNGVSLEGKVSLAKLIMTCTAGHGATPHSVQLVTWVDGCIHMLHLKHEARSVG